MLHDVTAADYVWGPLRFTPPGGLRDDTLVTFTANDGRANVTVARIDLAAEGGGAVEPFARAQEQALLARRLKGYAAKLSTKKVGGFDVVVIDREFVDGISPLSQRQAYVGVGQQQIVVVTGTAQRAANNASSALQQIVDDVVASLRVDHAPKGARP